MTGTDHLQGTMETPQTTTRDGEDTGSDSLTPLLRNPTPATVLEREILARLAGLSVSGPRLAPNHLGGYTGTGFTAPSNALVPVTSHWNLPSNNDRSETFRGSSNHHGAPVFCHESARHDGRRHEHTVQHHGRLFFYERTGQGNEQRNLLEYREQDSNNQQQYGRANNVQSTTWAAYGGRNNANPNTQDDAPPPDAGFVPPGNTNGYPNAPPGYGQEAPRYAPHAQPAPGDGYRYGYGQPGQPAPGQGQPTPGYAPPEPVPGYGYGQAPPFPAGQPGYGHPSPVPAYLPTIDAGNGNNNCNNVGTVAFEGSNQFQQSGGTNYFRSTIRDVLETEKKPSAEKRTESSNNNENNHEEKKEAPAETAHTENPPRENSIPKWWEGHPRVKIDTEDGNRPYVLVPLNSRGAPCKRCENRYHEFFLRITDDIECCGFHNEKVDINTEFNKREHVKGHLDKLDRWGNSPVRQESAHFDRDE